MKNIRVIFFGSISIIGVFLHQHLYARTVGSNSLVARQKEAYFRAGETNALLGFSVFEGGVIFQNENATCDIDVFFPLSGPLVLNGGTLTLKRDLIFKSPFYLGSGVVDADSYAIEFPRNISTIEIPSSQYKNVLSLVDQIDAITDINSVDWSFDSKYVAVGIDGTNSGSELRIYYFDDNVLTLTASYNFSNKTVYSVRWHPSDYYLATGRTSSNEFNIFYLDVPSGVFSLTDTKNIDTVFAVAWHPDGTHIAVGQYTNNNLLVYPVANGTLGSSSSVSFGSSRSVSRNALDWSSSGDYLAVGLYKSTNKDDFYVYAFDGSSLTLSTSMELGQNVMAIAWRPQATQIAIGTSGGSERMRLYEYDSQAPSLTEITTARVSEARSVYGLSWNSIGSVLATSRSSDSNGFEMKLFEYDTSSKKMNVVTGGETGQTTECVRWSPDGQYIASGDRSDMLKIFSLVDTPLTFRDAKLFFGSDVAVTTTVRFEGSCIVNAGSSMIDLTNGMFVVADDAELYLEHTRLKGLRDNKLHCTNDAGVVCMRDVALVLDDNTTFSTGAILFDDSVYMIGDATFAYQSKQTSTILAKSELELDAGITFSYDPIVTAKKDLLEFIDDTSVLSLNGATLHTTVTGMDITKGKIRIKDDAYLYAEKEVHDDHKVNVGFTFGNNNASEDVIIDIYGGEILSFISGKVSYKNVLKSSLLLRSLNSSINVASGVRLNLYQSIFLEPGFLTLAQQAVVAKVSGKKITGSVRPEGRYFTLGLRP